jgi:hypothetical protein
MNMPRMRDWVAMTCITKRLARLLDAIVMPLRSRMAQAKNPFSIRSSASAAMSSRAFSGLQTASWRSELS